MYYIRFARHGGKRFARFVVAVFPDLIAFGIGQTALLNSLPFISTLTLSGGV
jgi:hypothetical protein